MSFVVAGKPFLKRHKRNNKVVARDEVCGRSNSSAPA